MLPSVSDVAGKLLKAAFSGSKNKEKRQKRKGLTALACLLMVVCVYGAIRAEFYRPTMPPAILAMASSVDKACENPDIASEPTRTAWVCRPNNQQILQVIALLTSRGNPNYSGAGGTGIVPMNTRIGNQIAEWANIPYYNPLQATPSLTVAARAIDNILGGSSYWSAQQNRDVLVPGLEGTTTNCQRYTGSGYINHDSHLCAAPISTEGRSELASDVFASWMKDTLGQTATTKQRYLAMTLFTGWNDPGSPAVSQALAQLGYQPHRAWGL